MADTEKAPKTEAEKPAAAKAVSPPDPEKPASPRATAPPDPDRGAAASRRTKLVAETGRFVCKEPVIFMTPDGKRASAKVGEVVAIRESDARALTKRRLIESEEETAEG